MTDAAQDAPLVRLVHRVLMPGFGGTEAPDWVRRAVADGAGGVCLFSHNVDSVGQLRALTDDLHDLGPLVVSMDEEGGIVSRLGTMSTRPGSRHVGAAAMGAVDDLDLTRAVAAAIGSDLREVGVDLDLAPVADVSSNPDNPVIGVRAFGSDPRRVAEHVTAYSAGLRAAGVLRCAKHFPGHGDTNVDSHIGLPRIDVDLDTLRARELVPFAAAVDAGVEAVMTAHIVFPALDDQPATVSPAVLRLLREELGFEGLITSDAMDMQAMVDTYGLPEACVRALAAGVDLLGLGNPILNARDGGDEAIFRSAHDAVLAAVTDGRLPLARLQEAAARVDRLAAQAKSAREAAPSTGADTAADDAVATRALRTTGAVGGRLIEPVDVVDIRRRRNIAAGRTGGLIADALVGALPGSRSILAFPTGTAVDGHASEDAGGTDLPERADVVITGSPWLDERESAALTTLLEVNPQAVVICTGWTTDAQRLGVARHTVRTLGEDLPTARAVAALLVGSVQRHSG